MPRGPIRRAQLIAPFGVGALVVVRDGTSLISGGLDHWYKLESGEKDSKKLDPKEFEFEEWRLQRLLNVDHFCLPPDYRERKRGGDQLNTNITIPFLRFPQWHFCPLCNGLKWIPLSVRQKQRCEPCLAKGKRKFVVQVPFVAMCDEGHIQDFPWREWAHRSGSPVCDLPMQLIATGGASLAAQKVVCACGKGERNLASIMEAKPDGSTALSSALEGGQPYLCRGKRPWLGTEDAGACQRPIRGSLRSASNLHYPSVESAIYLPRTGGLASSELVGLLEQPPLSTLIKMFSDSGMGASIKPGHLRGQHPQLIRGFSDGEIADAITIVVGGEQPAAREAGKAVEGDDPETAFRRDEYAVLRQQHDEKNLLIREARMEDYDAETSRYFSRLMLIHKLRETRALKGFTRVFPENQQSLEARKDMLWRRKPEGRESWLPAYIVFGEGIFIEFKDELLRAWEGSGEVVRRAKALEARYLHVQKERHTRGRLLSPRLLLVHTFSHILMNRLTFECGYSSAALRERLYISSNPAAPMAGLLVYTAAGDAEGTMGGLVRMGKPGLFEPVVQRAIEGAKWCSADPVCMELGDGGGQGPDSCNLAACHNCALVPETACELFNRILDRGMAVGGHSGSLVSFFGGQ